MKIKTSTILEAIRQSFPEEIRDRITFELKSKFCGCGECPAVGLGTLVLPEEIEISDEQITEVNETQNAIREIISDYQNAEEIIEKGQRFLLVGKVKKCFGYPYPDTKEKYIVREILTILKAERLDMGKVEEEINKRFGRAIDRME